MGLRYNGKEAEGTTGRDAGFLNSLVQNVSDVIAVLEADGTLIYVSPAVKAMLGYIPEEVEGTPVFGYVHQDDLEGALGAFAETLVTPGGLPPLGFRAKHADGYYRHVEVVRNNRLDDPDVRGVVINIRDVTDRTEAEERYRAIVERVPAIVYVQEPDDPSRTTYISPQIEAITGYTPEECLADPDHWVSIMHPDDRERVLAEDGRTNETGDAFASEYRQYARDGRVVWLHDEATLVRDEEGEPLYWLGVQTDITERKATEAALREAEGRYATLLSNTPALVYRCLNEPGWPEVFVSDYALELTGYPAEDLLLGGPVRYGDLIVEGDRDRVWEETQEALAGHRRFRLRYSIRRKDGALRHVEEYGQGFYDEGGKVEAIEGLVYDVTEAVRSEVKLKEAEERYRTLVQEQTELVCRFLPDLTITFANEAYCRYFGLTPEEVVGSSFLERVPPEDRVYYGEQLAWLDEGNPRRTIEHRVLTPDGGVRWQQWTDAAVFDGEGGVVEYQSVGRDVTERREAEERLEHQALHDSLTGLPNRRLFVDRLGQALRRTRRKQTRVAVLFMDLDGFKAVNDSLGHEVGDSLLVAVAKRLRGCLRSEDTLVRFGGDEFVVMIEDIGGRGEAIRAAERIVEGLVGPFWIEDRELYARASVGIAFGEDSTERPEDLLRKADTAMYGAKEEGSGPRVFDPAMHERALGRLEMENGLRRAIERGEFVVHYQPIVRLGDRAVWGMEALVRWRHPERGLLDPGEFVPTAEESGLVVPMGEGVLREACRMAKAWQKEHPRVPPIAMSVNLSAKQLGRHDLAETVEGVLRETGLEPRCLALDVTETAYVGALEGNTGALNRLKAMGVGISIDDFGTGYASLSYLKRLPADALKIDGSFMNGLGDDVEDTAIVRMIIELAHTFGMEVVAEGVETDEQAALLEEMGCDMAQGYHFAEPLPAERVFAVLT